MNRLILFLMLKMILSYCKIPFIKDVKNIKLPLIRNIKFPFVVNEIPILLKNKIPTILMNENPIENEKPIEIENEKVLFLRNVNLPVCVNCKYFIEHKTYYPYEPYPDNKTYGRCKKFGYKDMVTGEFTYDYASYCRGKESKCGIKGKYFELEQLEESKELEELKELKANEKGGVVGEP